MKPDLAAFVDLVDVDSDGPEVVGDAFSKFLESATLAGGPSAARTRTGSSTIFVNRG